jgi:hypothetical protein
LRKLCLKTPIFFSTLIDIELKILSEKSQIRVLSALEADAN